MVGIYDNGNVFLDGALVIPLKEMQRFMDRQGMVTGFSLVMDADKKDAASIKNALGQIEQIAQLHGRVGHERGRTAVDFLLSIGQYEVRVISRRSYGSSVTACQGSQRKAEHVLLPFVAGGTDGRGDRSG